MPEAGDKIIKFNQHDKSIKIPFIIYADTECSLEKSFCNNDPTKSFTSKTNKHTTCGYLFTYCSFDNNESKNDFYRGEGSMKKFCANLKEQATKIINFQI